MREKRRIRNKEKKDGERGGQLLIHITREPAEYFSATRPEITSTLGLFAVTL